MKKSSLLKLVLALLAMSVPLPIMAVSAQEPIDPSNNLPITPDQTQIEAKTHSVEDSGDRRVMVGIRDQVYYEVIPSIMQSGKLTALVYNSIGHAQPEPDVFRAMDVDAIKAQFDAVSVVMNGPRYWTMDKLIGNDLAKKGQTTTILGYEFTKRSEIPMAAKGWSTAFYKERRVNRDSHYVFEGGRPIYELVAPGGSVYVMQSYSQIVNTRLTAGDLPNLGSRLNLPKGWKYQTITPASDYVLTASGTAYIVQDELHDFYQKIEPGTSSPSPSSH